MAAPSAAPGRGQVHLLAVLALAVVIGVVATLLVASAPPAPQPHAGELIVNLPTYTWGLLFLSPLIAGLGAILYRRWTEPVAVVPARTLVVFLVILLVAVAFVFLLAHGGTAGIGTISVSPGPPATNNSTHSPTNGTGGQHANGTGGTVPPASLITLDSWDLLAVVLGLSACVVVLSIPGVLSRLVDPSSRSGRGPPPDRIQVQSALADAGAAIDRGEDPRETVVRLYVRLLSATGPRAGDVSCLTPEEIRLHVFAVLGVRATASEVLTRLFEEARYSTHPIGPAEADRFREAVRQAGEDLVRGRAS